ncbi:hypothetical protein Hanom_Chr10g00895571 [Helianthus anomalus]
MIPFIIGFDPLVFDGMLLYDSLVLKFRRLDISRCEYSLLHRSFAVLYLCLW